MITNKNKFIKTLKNGEIVIVPQRLKDAIVESNLIKSDGKFLYYHDSTLKILRKFSDNINLSLRQHLFSKDIQRFINKNILDTIIDDLMVDTRIQIDSQELNPEYLINLKNGIFNLKNLQFISDKSQCNKLFTYIIDANYQTNIQEKNSPNFSNFLTTAFQNDNELQQYFLENMGFLLSSVNNLRKVVIFLGEHASGKSSMARFISKLIFPNDLVSHVNFQDISSRFSTYEIATAKLNIGDEMIKSKLKNLAKFKSITAGENIMVEQKCKNPIKIKPNVRQLYTANDLPEFDDGNILAIFDRLNIVPFNISIPRCQRNLSLVNDLLTEKDAIISIALKYFANVYRSNGVFSTPKDVLNLHKIYLNDINSIQIFFTKHIKFDEQSKGISTKELYHQYYQFCMEEDFTLKSSKVFSEMILRTFKNIERKKIRVGEKTFNAFTKLKYKDE
jgi:putative DNA primase/helicase